MTKPNYEAMSREELRSYILEHRDDENAFRIYLDRITSAPARELYPAPQSIDDLKNFPQLLEKFRQKPEGHSEVDYL